MTWQHLTDDDVPGRRRSSRPRTKQRPAHADALPAMVTCVDRGRYLTRLGARDVVAVKAREMGHRSVVVGDQAFLVGDTSGAKDTLARIVRVGPRRTELRRATEEGAGRERVIVANADRMVIVAALADPPPRTGMIDRQLVAAYDAGLDAVLCLTKRDLGNDSALRALYEPLGVEVVATGLGPGLGQGPERGLAQVRELLAQRVSVLVGHSGVGKSTLMNELVPGAGRATGAVNLVTGKGRHTSSSALALELEGGGWVIDTPGVRSFGLSHVRPERVLAAFGDLAEAAAACPRACPHGPETAECALRQWAVSSQERQLRVDSYLRIVASGLARGSKNG
ncbi:MAG: ribosome small subunit-dependent GTPase A [Bifidobacteriaceae bacterium]|nr:ribosome small subunit-dependent GTPase A [Bifidobacteriaceae bacterium]